MSLLLGCRRRLVSLSAKLVPVRWQSRFGPVAAYMPLDTSSIGADAVRPSGKWRLRRRRVLATAVAVLAVLALVLGLALGLGLGQVCQLAQGWRLFEIVSLTASIIGWRRQRWPHH